MAARLWRTWQLAWAGPTAAIRRLATAAAASGGAAAARTWAPRTHTCGQLQAADVGRRVVLNGWIQRPRCVPACRALPTRAERSDSPPPVSAAVHMIRRACSMLGELAFAGLRDGYGTTQVVWRRNESPEAVRVALEALTPESVVSVHGTVQARPADMQRVRRLPPPVARCG